MRVIERAGLTVVLLLVASSSFAGTPPAKTTSAPKNSPGSIVIIFKDGHRQAFNLADIARVEFSGTASGETAEDATSGTGLAPSRGRFIAKWEVGDGNGSNFFITLRDNGDAFRSLGDVHGKWAYVDGEARVTWDDGAKDAIRKVGARYQKFAYKAGKSFSDEPDNITNARNPNLGPI